MKYVISMFVGGTIAMFTGMVRADIVSVEYTDQIVNVLQKQIEQKADSRTVVHINGNETIQGEKTFSGPVKVSAEIVNDSDDNSVATTKWTNDRIDDVRGTVRVGGPDSEQYVQMWVE